MNNSNIKMIILYLVFSGYWFLFKSPVTLNKNLLEKTINAFLGMYHVRELPVTFSFYADSPDGKEYPLRIVNYTFTIPVINPVEPLMMFLIFFAINLENTIAPLWPALHFTIITFFNTLYTTILFSCAIILTLIEDFLFFVTPIINAILYSFYSIFMMCLKKVLLATFITLCLILNGVASLVSFITNVGFIHIQLLKNLTFAIKHIENFNIDAFYTVFNCFYLYIVEMQNAIATLVYSAYNLVRSLFREIAFEIGSIYIKYPKQTIEFLVYFWVLFIYTFTTNTFFSARYTKAEIERILLITMFVVGYDVGFMKVDHFGAFDNLALEDEPPIDVLPDESLENQIEETNTKNQCDNESLELFLLYILLLL